MRWVLITIPFVFFIWFQASGQLSQGGRPLEIPVLKSTKASEIMLPVVNNKELRQHYEALQEHSPVLKPFQFAHGFDVNITVRNSGIWYSDINGYDIWRVTLKSAGAYSLNLIFSYFKLEPGARLFLWNEDEGQYLGAYTSVNNKESGKFAVSPVAGERLTIQYEVPAGRGKEEDFVISEVNHDFTDILKSNDRRPLGISAGSCNVDFNCEVTGDWSDPGDAVCRIIVNGREICTGVLVNNTGGNKRPYVLSAAHCYDLPELAETSVFTFNYESPFCEPLDGDASNSVSGAEMRAFSDSLDFSLVEMSIVPPPDYRPYFAGWDRSGSLPDSTASIHHPQGDIKKIAVDRNAPVISDFQSDYTTKGFLRVLRWEEGVTEQGSSGSPLFNPSGYVVGTLTGGSATCRNPVNDYFSRFDLAWEYKNDTSQQLKYWLDPLNTNQKSLPGERYYSGEEFCLALTHLDDEDEHENIIIYDNNRQAGYWGGTNKLNITEFSERFVVSGNAHLYGISIGVGLIKLASAVSNSAITIKIYEGDIFPEDEIYSQEVEIRSLTADALNLILFDEVIVPTQTFFIGFELSKLQPQEEFAVYQSLRESDKPNYFWFRQDNQWFDFKQSNNEGYSLTNVMSLVACNVSGLATDTPLVSKPMERIVYPNPAKDIFTFEAGQNLIPENIKVFNLIGQEVEVRKASAHEKKIVIDLSGNLPGVYFVRYNSELGSLSEKVIYAPW